jgi:hypothetical protein
LVRFENKLYPWTDACPLLLSLLLYKKPFRDVIGEEETVSGTSEKSAFFPSGFWNKFEIEAGENSCQLYSKTVKCNFKVFQWQHDARIVVSEVFSMELMGTVYEALLVAGYQMLFLTSDMYHVDAVPGPLLIHPTAFVKSISDHHLCKDEMIKQLSEMFPKLEPLTAQDAHPFSIGIGRLETDAVCYRNAGIPLNRIFIMSEEETGRFYYYDTMYRK